MQSIFNIKINAKVILISVSTLVTALFGAEDPVPMEPSGVLELFNGKDLSGWYTFIKGRGRDCDPKGVFTVLDGKIHISGEEFGCITTEKAYKNYVLTVEYRWVGEASGDRVGRLPDSGILYHSIGEDGAWYGIWKRSFEYNVIKSQTGDLIVVECPEFGTNSPFRVSAVVDSQKQWRRDALDGGAGKLEHVRGYGRINSCWRHPAPADGFADEAKEGPYEHKTGEWNVATIICDGDTVIHKLNGETVVMACNVSPNGGRIQLQSEGHGIEFRRVTIEPISREFDAGHWKTFDYEHPDLTPIVFGGESRAENAEVIDYCIYLDVYHPDGSATWGVRVNFARGTHGWQRVVGGYVPSKPIQRIEAYALCRNGQPGARAKFRNFFLERRMGCGDRLEETRFSNRPFSESEEVSYFRFDGVTKTPCREIVPAGDFGHSPLAPGTSVVWTASAARRLSPLAFPSERDFSHKLAFDVARRGSASAQVLISTADDVAWATGDLVLSSLVSETGHDFDGDYKWERVGYVPRSCGYLPHPLSSDEHEKWIADPLLPAAAFSVRKGATQALWLTVTAGAETPAGHYNGRVTVRRDGRIFCVLPVELVVRDFSLPQTFGLKTSFALMDGFLRRQYPVDWKSLRRKAQDVLLDHRLNPDDITRTALPDIEDLLHARERGMNHFTVLNLVPEPSDTNSLWTCYARPEDVFSDDFYSTFKSRLSPYVTELRRFGLDRLAAIYGFDEREDEYFPGISRISNRLKHDFPGLKVLTTAKMYASLSARWKDYVLGKTNVDDLVMTDIYCPGTRRWRPEVTEFLKSHGKKVWWYTCNGPQWPYANFASYENPLIEARIVIGFQTHLNRADGFLFWHVNYWKEKDNEILSECDTFFPNWSTADPCKCSGDGVLLYPGRDTVYPSLRLAQLRDGVEDYEWLQLATKKSGCATVDAVSRTLCSSLTDFTRDPESFECARSRLAELIEGPSLAPSDEDGVRPPVAFAPFPGRVSAFGQN